MYEHLFDGASHIFSMLLAYGVQLLRNVSATSVEELLDKKWLEHMGVGKVYLSYQVLAFPFIYVYWVFGVWSPWCFFLLPG